MGLTPADYKKMLQVNRRELTEFLSRISLDADAKAQINKNNEETMNLFENFNMGPSNMDMNCNFEIAVVNSNGSPVKGSVGLCASPIKGSTGISNSFSPVKTINSSMSNGDALRFPDRVFALNSMSEHNSDIIKDSKPTGQIFDPSEQPDDEEIYKNFVLLLLARNNGCFLTQNILGHFEYFMNTLKLNLKTMLENPFEYPENYPAFEFKVADDVQKQLKDAIIEAPSGSSDEESDESMSEDEMGLVDHDEVNATPPSKKDKPKNKKPNI